LLARTEDDTDVADKLSRILTDPGLAASMRQRGLERARAFSWQETVKRTQAAFGELPVAGGLQPLLAWFVPPTSRRPRAADHARALLEGLRRHYAIHLYHDAGQIPDVALARSDYAAFDWRLFDRHDRVWNYYAVLYDFGESVPDGFMHQVFFRRPGIALLHRMSRADLKVISQILSSALGAIVTDAGFAESARAAACRDRVLVVSGTALHDGEVAACVDVIEKVAVSPNAA